MTIWSAVSEIVGTFIGWVQPGLTMPLTRCRPQAVVHANVPFRTGNPTIGVGYSEVIRLFPVSWT